MNKKTTCQLKIHTCQLKIHYSIHVIVSPFRGYGLLFQQRFFFQGWSGKVWLKMASSFDRRSQNVKSWTTGDQKSSLEFSAQNTLNCATKSIKWVVIEWVRMAKD